MPPYAFFKNEFVPLSKAKVGVMTHALHYGTACFEGIRGNWNAEEEQLYIFRCPEHYQRLLDYITPDFVHVLADGRIAHSGGRDLALELEKKGYGWLGENGDGARPAG